MSAADITTWESLVGFCSGFFDLLNNTFNSSLLGEFLKARVFMGYSYSYGSLLCTFLVTGIVVSKVRDVIIRLVIPDV